MKTIVLGNSRTLSGQGRGRVIDEYDVVVRTNLYRTAGFEEDVGSRTTHWMTVCNKTILDAVSHKDCSEFEEVWMKAYPWHVPNLVEMSDRLSDVRVFVWINPLRPLRNFEAWNRFVAELKKTDQIPTTGIMAVATAIERFGSPVDVAGFSPRDALQPGYYYGKGREHLHEVHRVRYCPGYRSCHDFERERIVLNCWEAEGIINRIDTP